MTSYRGLTEKPSSFRQFLRLLHAEVLGSIINSSQGCDFFFGIRIGGGEVGYCMVIKIVQMALSYYLKKHHGWNGSESAARARGAICRTVKSVQMIQSVKRE